MGLGWNSEDTKEHSGKQTPCYKLSSNYGDLWLPRQGIRPPWKVLKQDLFEAVEHRSEEEELRGGRPAKDLL
jgi:hypothetical protein